MFGRKKTNLRDDTLKAISLYDVSKGRRVRYTYEKCGVKYDIRPERIMISLMVGARRCGKTTLLCSMVRSFRKLIADRLEFEALDVDTQNELEAFEYKLKDFTDAPTVRLGIDPTFALNIYDFILFDPRTSVPYLFRFVDVPGEWVKADEYRDNMQKLIEAADVLLFTVHSPALMELNGEFCEKIIAPQRINELAGAICSKRNSKRKLVLFVPIMCERYYWNSIDTGTGKHLCDVKQATEQLFGSLIHSFAEYNGRMEKGITAAILPVLTTGGVKLYKIEHTANIADVAMCFIRVDRYVPNNGWYRPIFCEQPMLYIMRFFINTRFKSKKGIFVRHSDTDVDRYIEKLTAPYGFDDSTDFSMFESKEAWRGIEPLLKYPLGTYTNVEFLGMKCLNDPQGWFATKEKQQ